MTGNAQRVPADIDPETTTPVKNGSETQKPARSGEEDEHLGATEDQVTAVKPPKGPDFADEPKQG
jgi:hypothetical protein